MAVVELHELPSRLAGQAIIGVDHGEKTLGLAISDVGLTIASPMCVIAKRKFTADAERLFALMEERGAGGLVIGLPIGLDGREGPRCQSVRAFARNLLRLRDLPIAFWDERLSTAAVNRMLIDEADASRARRAASVDKLAAAWILQGALDRLRAGRTNPTTAL